MSENSYTGRILYPMLERAVYGLLYPAILGANLLLFLEHVSERWDIYSYAWGLTLALFILDFVGTATEGVPNAPQRTCWLPVVDGLAALLFFVAQTALIYSRAGKTRDVDLFIPWIMLLLLHALYFLWYMSRKNASKNSEFDNYAVAQIIVIVDQVLLFVGASILWGPIEPRTYIVICIIALIGWTVRQGIEFAFSR